MKEKFLKQTEREYSPRERLTALAIEGVLFLGILPVALVYVSRLVDKGLGLPLIRYGFLNQGLGWLMVAGGILFALWAIYVQFTIGRGTPAPVMATQKLIVEKPYNYCRNPMALGTIVLYLGEAIVLGSISAVFLVGLGATLLLIYIKVLEEKEMELRFGEDYHAYRKETPFIIPRFWRKS